ARTVRPPSLVSWPPCSCREVYVRCHLDNIGGKPGGRTGRIADLGATMSGHIASKQVHKPRTFCRSQVGAAAPQIPDGHKARTITLCGGAQAAFPGRMSGPRPPQMADASTVVTSRACG